MLKVIFFSTILAAIQVHAIYTLSMVVKDLKTKKVQTKISMPFWVADVGHSVFKMLDKEE